MEFIGLLSRGDTLDAGLGRSDEPLGPDKLFFLGANDIRMCWGRNDSDSLMPQLQPWGS